MSPKLNKFILLIVITLISNLLGFTQDLSVFDLKINEPFDIRECNYQVVEVKFPRTQGLLWGREKVKMYQYVEEIPASGKCFKRVGTNYTVTPQPNSPEAKKLPPVVPVNNQKVKLVYSNDLRPSIAESEDIWVGIQDSKLTGIRFYFPHLKAKEISQILVNKYGKASSVEDFYIQNGIGGRKDFYQAKWEFPKLTVTLLSLDTKIIGYDPSKYSVRGYSSEIGSVTIQYKLVGNKPKDKNPL